MVELADVAGEHAGLETKETSPAPFWRQLRATAMDELPRPWNIFRGAMSFIGPRALMPEEIEVGQTGGAGVQVYPISRVDDAG